MVVEVVEVRTRTSMTSLLIAGATGLVGSQALEMALHDPRITRIVAPTRRPLPAHEKVFNPIMSADDLQPDAAWWSVDGALCTIGTTRARAGSAAAFRAVDLDYALAIAGHVRRGGASRFALTSSMGADSRSRFLYTRTKGELEGAITALDFESLTIVRPGLLEGERSERRVLEALTGVVLRAVRPILPLWAQPSPAATVAVILVEAAISGAPGRHIVESRDIAAMANESLSAAGR